MSITLLTLVLVSYLLVLFWIARQGEKQRFIENSWTRKPLVYALALGVYCTSWTFYGLVGTAADRAWSFAPILLGPMLLFLFGQPLLKRVASLCHQENIRSIADFMASRYGKRRGIATSVALIVFVATIPYIALQIKAVTDTFLLLAGDQSFSAEKAGMITAIAMIVFAQLFGVKRLDVSGYHAGLISAIAFESLIKLLALVLLAVFALFFVGEKLKANELELAWQSFASPDLNFRFWLETGISAAAILCLPRMFHVTFVENLSDKHLSTARFVFPLYLGLIGFCIIVIAVVGNAKFAAFSPAFLVGAVESVPPDTYVLALPLSESKQWLTLLVFLGGFSAATAMIIVATVTLSHMLSNDVILPILIRRRQNTPTRAPPDYSRYLMLARRTTIVIVVSLAYLYQRILAGNVALTDIGLIAFALVVQLFPALIFGIYSGRGNAMGTYAGLAAGCFVWFVTLIVPLLVQSSAISPDIMSDGILGLSWFRPEHLFGFEFSDAYTRGVLISLIVNASAYWLFSQLSEAKLVDRVQASAFLDQSRALPGLNENTLNLIDLRELLSQFIGDVSTHTLIERHRKSAEPAEISAALVDEAEHALAGIVGVASAQTMIASLSTGKQFAVDEVVTMFGETTKALRFNQELVNASFETISSAISVVNPDLHLVAWNRRYEEMFDYPAEMLEVGIPVETLVRFNSSRGLMGAGSADDHVARRLEHLRAGKPYRVVRSGGRGVIEIKGSPLPGGGYVTTYEDISEFIDAQERLEKSNLYLEQRVKERTIELQAAQKEAEEANRGKSRFLALASHDILQPLNAANLYTNVLLENSEKCGDENVDTLQHLNSAIASTESIISTLLEIAKLDIGALSIGYKVSSLNALLEPLVNEIRMQIGKGVELHFIPSSVFVKTDPRYLRRIVQNFLSNAAKFTEHGKILVGVRRRTTDAEIFVYDTGPGIHPEDQKLVFDDFYRSASQSDVQGLGLGLGVAARFSRLLEHPIRHHSELGKGSWFSVSVPMGEALSSEANKPEKRSPSSVLEGKTAYYVDDDKANIHAMETLLKNWGCQFRSATSVAEAISIAELNDQHVPDFLLMDFQLDQENNGIQLAKTLIDIWGQSVPCCLVSASQDPNLSALASSHNFEFLRKPIKPGKLRAILEHLLKSEH